MKKKGTMSRSFISGAIMAIVAALAIGSVFAVYYAGNQQIISAVTTGTSPFSITSTTKVDNLNIDTLDGIDSAGLMPVAPSMYLTSSTFTGAHECDDTPSGCCAAGYHMCTTTEVAQGGRRVETTGTGRDTAPAGQGDADVGINLLARDCNGWSSATATYDRPQCNIGDTGATCALVLDNCGASEKVWCCSD